MAFVPDDRVFEERPQPLSVVIVESVVEVEFGPRRPSILGGEQVQAQLAERLPVRLVVAAGREVFVSELEEEFGRCHLLHRRFSFRTIFAFAVAVAVAGGRLP